MKIKKRLLLKTAVTFGSFIVIFLAVYILATVAVFLLDKFTKLPVLKQANTFLGIANKKVPYSVEDKVDNPVSLYAATKKSNELMAHAYSKLYNIPSTGLRFFTVYYTPFFQDLPPFLYKFLFT